MDVKCSCAAALVVLLSAAQAFEFDRDSCLSLLPNQKLHPVDNGEQVGVGGSMHRQHHHDDDDDFDEEAESYEDEGEDEHDMESDTDLYRLRPRTGTPPFRLRASKAIYRRNRPLTVTIEGPEFNAFILMAKSRLSQKPQPVGTFESLPPSAKHLHCVLHRDAVTNRDTGGKMNIQFQWKAPDEDNGNINFIGTVVQKDAYWANVKSDDVVFKQFPPSFAECGRSKSCYRYSTKVPNCEPEECDYVVITKITEENEIELTIGGIMENNGYIGMGFTLDNQKLSHMDLSACIKKGSTTEMRQYIVDNWKAGPRTFNKVAYHDDVDQDGQMIWCQWLRPLKVPGPHLADLTQSLHHAFLWGSLNETNGLPILPPRSDILFVPQPWNYSNTINMIHYVGADAAHAHSSLCVTGLAVVLILFLQFSNTFAT